MYFLMMSLTVHNTSVWCLCILIAIYVPLCVGRSKEKAGIHLKYYPENRDTFEMYPGKVIHIIAG